MRINLNITDAIAHFQNPNPEVDPDCSFFLLSVVPPIYSAGELIMPRLELKLRRF